ncbi:hypothetical protein R1flu_029198 [Riccia fluitans]|uniref:Uncharacterized protein n=1 Tax=Riccia fluitans TaxID=41844 RepID=A0ABD1XNU8_9MARC
MARSSKEEARSKEAPTAIVILLLVIDYLHQVVFGTLHTSNGGAKTFKVARIQATTGTSSNSQNVLRPPLPSSIGPILQDTPMDR